MPHIQLHNAHPGIRGALAFRPEVAAPLGRLTDALLRDASGLSRAERELIGMHVSALNDCEYCCRSHAAIACIYLGNNKELVNQIRNDYAHAPISGKLKALLQIAGKAQQNGKLVTTADVEEARRHGATEMDIHDTVLIAALFSLFNRYVDGLATTTPPDDDSYGERARQVATDGYAGVSMQIGES
jgi:uncharacterized peroxidase-related enzyme